MTEKLLTRRNLISNAGLAIGGALAVKVLSACGDDSGGSGNGSSALDGGPDGSSGSGGTGGAGGTGGIGGTGGGADAQPDVANPDATDGENPDASCLTGPQPKDWPYEQHLPAGYKLDLNDVREKAYHYYYSGGCCHGSYRALLEHLATTAGQPFNLMPLDFGKFGAGGIAGYGSICGALLGANLIINSIVASADARSAMLTSLMRWYERTAFPTYIPKVIDTNEKDLTKDFSAANIVNLQVVPDSHLCHASVSGWCALMKVSASGADKKARCARLTADVAAKAAEMINEYLANKAFTVLAPDPLTKTCVTCHTGAIATFPVASGMTCGSCHDDKTANHP